MLRDSPCELACQQQQQQLENEATTNTGEVVILSESVRDGTMCGDRYINKMLQVCGHPFIFTLEVT